ncbi:MAG TPA: apolipoprotein N-acyltransferase, partial [Armatimonadota bacterium]|nr:apolipoprotein N-acyltransferase [Armatimonadota bacterium]
MRRGIVMGALGAVATGAMLAALFPNVGASGLAWVALVPLILAARASTPRGAACQGFAAGVLFFLILIAVCLNIVFEG